MAQRIGRRSEVTRQAILDAAEAVFAEHGYDGARVDVIAAASGYNKTLIFRYFGDKLGLYAEVLRRADLEMGALLAGLFAPLLKDERIAADPARFRAFLEATFGALYDYMVAHPRFTRMINWEQAEAWQSVARIAGQFEPRDFPRFEAVFCRAQAAGLLRPGIDIRVAILLALQVCWSAPTALPLLEALPAGDTQSTNAHSHLRDQVVAFLLAGITAEPANNE